MKITNEVLKKIIAHSWRDTPIEACGYLAGKEGVALMHYELTNVDGSSEHFSFDPSEQFNVLKDARNRGYELLAMYHSHPVSAPIPSEEDKRCAYDPEIVYMIISLEGGLERTAAYRIIEGEVVPEKLEKINYDQI